MKDAARLLAYLALVLLFGAFVAPPLFWLAQWLNARGLVTFLASYDFETFFHRALLIGALLFFWPLLRWLEIHGWRELRLEENKHAVRDLGLGFIAAAVPLFCFAVGLLWFGVYSWRPHISVAALVGRSLSALVVPFIEEPLFRGLILGVLLRAMKPAPAALVTSAFFSILHFLKAPEQTSAVVTWASGLVSIANALSQFTEPVLVLAGFTTLLLLGCVLADARLRTRSLWMPIGLHAGWIFCSVIFNKIARGQAELLPWLGKNLLIGIAPLCIALITWGIIRALTHEVEINRA